jgi:hypothetical protein
LYGYGGRTGVSGDDGSMGSDVCDGRRSSPGNSGAGLMRG